MGVYFLSSVLHSLNNVSRSEAGDPSGTGSGTTEIPSGTLVGAGALSGTCSQPVDGDEEWLPRFQLLKGAPECTLASQVARSAPPLLLGRSRLQTIWCVSCTAVQSS